MQELYSVEIVEKVFVGLCFGAMKAHGLRESAALVNAEVSHFDEAVGTLGNKSLDDVLDGLEAAPAEEHISSLDQHLVYKLNYKICAISHRSPSISYFVVCQPFLSIRQRNGHRCPHWHNFDLINWPLHPTPIF